jgi:SAM-dependent methyltransferase
VRVSMYKKIIIDLRRSYDRMVEERDSKELAPWKEQERNEFLSLLLEEQCGKLLEIGAGTGLHGSFFQDQGMQVVCTDLSPEMVKRCSEKGLEAYVMDFLHLDFPQSSFDVVFAMNCLLHVPKENLPQVLEKIHGLLRRNGLFYWGQYGGVERDGIYDGDHYEPKRYFSFITDEFLMMQAQELFEVVFFKRIELEREEDFHFQSLVLRKD